MEKRSNSSAAIRPFALAPPIKTCAYFSVSTAHKIPARRRFSLLFVISTACPLTPALSENPTSLLQLGRVEGPPKLLLLGWVWGAPPRLSPEWGFVVEEVTISSNSIQIAVELLA